MAQEIVQYGAALPDADYSNRGYLFVVSGSGVYHQQAGTWTLISTPPHNLLSASHLDTTAASVVRGDIIIGNSTPKWTRLAVGAANALLGTDGTDVSWFACTAAGRAILDDASAGDQRTTLGVGTADSPQFAAVNVGHASDTTLARASAGVLTVEGNVIYAAGGTDVALADGGTGASLADPGADRIMFWDDSAGVITWLTAGSGLTITDTTITASGGGEAAANAVLRAERFY